MERQCRMSILLSEDLKCLLHNSVLSLRKNSRAIQAVLIAQEGKQDGEIAHEKSPLFRIRGLRNEGEKRLRVVPGSQKRLYIFSEIVNMQEQIRLLLPERSA